MPTPKNSKNNSRAGSAENESHSAARKAPVASTKKTEVTSSAGTATEGRRTFVNVHIKPSRYYVQIPAALRTKPAKKKAGVLTKIVSSLIGGKERAPQLVRDFPFMTAAGPQFFATDKKATIKKYGVSHGDRLYYKLGPLAGTYCSVIGVRGGMLWVVNDISKKDYEGSLIVARPDFIEKDLSGAFDGGFATPLYNIYNAEDLRRAGIEFVVRGGMLNQTVATDDFPAPLVDFLKYAPDMSLNLNETGDKLIIPPLVTATGEIGWSSAGAFESFYAGGIEEPTEARALVSIVPLLVPVEYLDDKKDE